MSRKFLSRKSIISFIAVGVLAAATLASGAAQAHHSGGPGGHPGGHPGSHWGHWGHYHHYVHFHDRIYVRPVSYAVRTTTPGPCTCLTKNYTPEGRVVFQDLCTKEMASAPADGSSDQTQNEQGPANMAGQSYQDYLKANPQAAQTQKN
jgi:hypothetical protein